MTAGERLKRTLDLERIGGQVPHFELSMFLSLEAIGKVHPKHRNYAQWNQMSESEKKLTMEDMADTYIQIAQKYNYSAIFVNYEFSDAVEQAEFLKIIRERCENEYMLFMHGGATFGIPSGDCLEEFSYRLVDEPEKLHEEAELKIKHGLERARRYHELNGPDGFILCDDYAFNVNPFLGKAHFDEFVTPYLCRLVAGYRELGYYTIIHSDGNIMPIIDSIVKANPHCLQSLDPQGGVSLAKVKEEYGDRLCLMGNVNCGLLQTGTDEECKEDILRALKEGMSGGRGYIFSTSNCIYTGMSLSRYELMQTLWKKHGSYDLTGENKNEK